MTPLPSQLTLVLAVVVGLAATVPAAASAQGRTAPSLRSLLDACPPRGIELQPGPPYRAPAWLLRGEQAPPAGTAPDPEVLAKRL